MITIRKATQEDTDATWEIIKAFIATGDTYVFNPASSKEKMLGWWFGADRHTYVALADNKIAGIFLIKDNQPDLGSHVANAAYMTAPDAAGKGIGSAMGTYSLEEAKRLGYTAMQFNIVIKTNERAVKLWQKLGFSIIGEIPEAFKHKRLGYVNAYIMYQRL